MSDYRSKSRQTWENDNISTHEMINVGSLQRIADATEKMAASYDRLREDRDYWRRRYEQEHATAVGMGYTIRTLRGVITKLKRGAK